MFRRLYAGLAVFLAVAGLTINSADWSPGYKPPAFAIRDAKIVVFDELGEADRMDLLPPADHFVGTVRVDILDQMRKGHGSVAARLVSVARFLNGAIAKVTE